MQGDGETEQAGTPGRYGYSAGEYARFKRRAWAYLLIFSALYMSLYCCRLNLSNASAAMIGGLGWTTSDIGILTSTLFWTYGVGQLVNGRLSEVVGPSKLLVLGVAASIACNLFISLQSSLMVMAVVWGLNGWFQSMGWTPGLASLTKWWPRDSRGFASGFANAASGFGQAVATMAVALAFALFPDMGWRAAFLIPAAFPLALLIVYKLFAKPSPAAVGLPEYVEEDAGKAAAEREMARLKTEHGQLFPYRYVLSKRVFRVWLVVAFATGLARYGLVTWVPLYFVQAYGIDIGASLLQSLTLPVGMGVGTLVVPWLTDRFCPDNRLVAVVASAIVSAAAVLAFLFLDPTTTGGLVAVEAALFVAGFGVYGISGTVWAFATDIGGRVFSGTAGGMLDCAVYMGAAIQSLVYGFLLTSGGWSVLFASLALFCLLIAGLSLLSTKLRA